MQSNRKSSFSQFLTSFKYAFNGIAKSVYIESKIRFHYLAAVAVIIAGFFFNVSLTSWALLVFAIGLVIVSEMFNTAIEKIVDLVSPQQHPLAGLVKDLAAGAVLISAITAAIIGLLVFLPEIL
jgi:diacylglycerol kinase (ATP)